MTAPVDLPVVGRVKFNEVSKETLLALLAGHRRRARDCSIDFGTRMERLDADGGGLPDRDDRAALLHAGAVLLAIGRRGTPRKLGVPGEELPKVVYRLIEAEQYRGQRVLVVGGGDSALEAALACAERARHRVTLAYRGDAFSRVKPKNRERLEAARAAERVDVRLQHRGRAHPRRSGRAHPGRNATRRRQRRRHRSGRRRLPTALLRELGVTVETKYGTA